MPTNANTNSDRFATGRRSVTYRDEFGSIRRPGVFADSAKVLAAIDEDVIRAAHDAWFALRAGY